MKALRCAALALAIVGLSAQGAESTNDWWEVDFQSPTPVAPEGETWPQGYGGVNLPVDEGTLGSLTNYNFQSGDPQPYLAGHWTMIDGDESYITNSFNATNLSGRAFGGDNCIKLDTQGNDLTWVVDADPQNDHTMADGRKALVDADLYLVGSDSPPDASDFDAASDVQTAVYLKNETDEDSGETTNSVLCVYVYDDKTEENYWQELDGVELKDNAWAHVQVLVDHSTGDLPEVKVYVNGTEMHARNGNATYWFAANGSESQTAGKVSSVAFRGTGAVDNFVGKTISSEDEMAVFKAILHLDDNVILDELVTDRITINSRTDAEFLDIAYEELDSEDTPVYGLSKIEIVDFVNGGVRTHDFKYDPDDDDNDGNFISPAPTEGEVRFGIEGGELSGFFSVFAPTVGAPGSSNPADYITNVVAHIYFKSAYAKDAYATVAMDGNVTTNAYVVKPVDVAEGATKTLTWEFPATTNGNVLSTIRVHNGAEFVGCANRIATVTVTLDEELDEDTLFAEAVYVEGTLADGQDLTDDGGVDGLYTFTAFVPPVALRITVAEGTVKTNEYPSLLLAIQAAEPGETVYLVADDRVSFSAGNTEIAIGKALTIDGGSNTLYGVSGYAYDGVNDHDIFIGAAAGDVTIRNLRITEFSDTAPTVQYRTYPIWTSQGYAGKLTLDGVTIDKFARTAINLGNGTFEITNCVITGCAGATGAPERYFQNAFGVLNAKGTVADTTATGLGSTADPWGAGVVTFNSDGDGELTFLSGTYTSDYVLEVSSNAVGKLAIEGGTFVATADAADSAFQLDEGDDATFKVEVSGGWFDREPEEGFIADGLAAYEDAPGTDAPWTVRAEKFTITFMNGATKLDEIEVEKNGAVAYAGETPEKEGTAQYSYTFAGWSTTDGGEALESLPDATANATYYAVFTESVNQYKVEWIVDGDRTTNEWAYGATPSYGANDPTKESTNATNFTFKAWNPEVVAVTGFASYTATWTETARTYAITFQTNGVDYATVDAEWHATGYAPADPAAPEGKVFKGWALSTAPTTVLDTLPEVSGAATYVAVFDDDAVEVHVNPGDGLDSIENAPAPIEFTAAGLCKIAFKAPAAGKYVLMTSETVNGTYLAEGTPVEFAAGALVELTETTAGTTKFFKIGYEK